jgi:Predicted glycosyltransferases
MKNIDYDNYSIVIVDNGSPNKSGEKLLKLYNETPNIKVIISNKNLGFAKGNNIGFKYAKYDKKADFIVMINNDTIIRQKNFCDELINQYLTQKYDICGPNIISLIDNQHQNPVAKIFYNDTQVRRMVKKFKILLLLNYIRCDRIVEFVLEKRNNVSKNINNNEDIQLHGSCLIFSPTYIEKYNGLYDRTFMYIEECILKYISERDNLKMVYCDKVTIYHKEDSSTNASMNKGYKKRRFYYKNSINSCNLLISLMKEN